MSDIQVTVGDGQGTTVVAGVGDTINVSTGTVLGPLPQLQIAAGTGITIQSSGGVSTISANVGDLSVPSNLADLTDVQSGASNGQVLSYNGTAWAGLTLSIPANLADLANVNGSPTTGQVLAWNGTAWAGLTLPIPANLADLANVNGSPTTGQVLAWNGTAWGPADDQTGGSSDVVNLADLNDVSATSPITGQSLIWNGSSWGAANVPVTTQINGLSGNITLASVVGPGLSVDEAGELSLADETPRDVVLSRAGDTGLLASFSRQAAADTQRGLDAYEVEFISVPTTPAVVAADQIGDNGRTLFLQAVVEEGDRLVEFGESADNGSTWVATTMLLDDDSGVAVYQGAPWASLSSGDRLYRVRSGDTAANLNAATYSGNFSATYTVLPYHEPVPIQAYSLGSDIVGVAAFAADDVARTDLNLAAVNVTVGFSAGTTTYATSSTADGNYPQVFAGFEEYPENSTPHKSLLTVPGEGWGLLSFRSAGGDGNGDEVVAGGEFYNFAGNYSLPKSAGADSLPALFLVADGVSATNLPAGITAGVFSGGVGVTTESARVSHLRYMPDASQEFEFPSGGRSTITLTANLSATDNVTGGIIVEAQEMWEANETNENATLSTEPTINIVVRNANGAEIANQSSIDDLGNAFASLSTSLDAGAVYPVEITMSHQTSGRGFVPKLTVRPSVRNTA